MYIHDYLPFNVFDVPQNSPLEFLCQVHCIVSRSLWVYCTLQYNKKRWRIWFVNAWYMCSDWWSYKALDPQYLSTFECFIGKQNDWHTCVTNVWLNDMDCIFFRDNMNNEHAKKLFIVITLPSVKGTNWD
jgi:hypothetical protein